MTNEFELLPSPHFLTQITITNWISTLPAQTSKFISDDLKVSIYFWYIPFLLKTDALFCLFVRQYRSADQMVSFKRSDSIVQEVENLPVFYSDLTPIQRYPTRLITLSKKIHSFFFAILNNSLTFVLWKPKRNAAYWNVFCAKKSTKFNLNKKLNFNKSVSYVRPKVGRVSIFIRFSGYWYYLLADKYELSARLLLYTWHSIHQDASDHKYLKRHEQTRQRNIAPRHPQNAQAEWLRKVYRISIRIYRYARKAQSPLRRIFFWRSLPLFSPFYKVHSLRHPGRRISLHIML